MNKNFLYKWLKIFKINKVKEPFNSIKIIFTEYTNAEYKDFNLFKANKLKLNFWAYKKLNKLFYYRSLHFPIQYIIGYWEFRNIFVYLKPKILIPRVETSKIIDLTENIYKKNYFEFFEIGLGSGIISLSLINELNCKGIGCDIDKTSIKLINKNKYFNKNKLEIYHSDFEKLLKNKNKKYNLIISNPPYITENDYKNLDKQIKLYENYNALVSKEDGYYHCKNIIYNCYKYLKDYNSYIILELDPIQINKIKNDENIKKIYSSIEYIEDYFNRLRFVI